MMVDNTPTSLLPPLTHLPKYSSTQINEVLVFLGRLYFPLTSLVDSHPYTPDIPAISGERHCSGFMNASSFEKGMDVRLPGFTQVRVKRSVYDSSVPDSGYASAEEEGELDADDVIEKHSPVHTQSGENVFSGGDPSEHLDQDILRSDALERNYTITWLTGFVKRSDTWISQSLSDVEIDAGAEEESRTVLVDKASKLLALFAGDDEAEEALIRRFVFPFPSGRGVDCVAVELNDAPLTRTDHTSVGLQSWASSIVLSKRMCADPSRFGLQLRRSGKTRVLELGAGTGLLSIVSAKIFLSSVGPNGRPLEGEVVATDYHPDVIANLTRNVHTNFNFSASTSPVEVTHLDWAQPDFSFRFFSQPFDVVLGADIVYHPDHAQCIKTCVERLLRRPADVAGGEDEGGVFWLIMPVRSTGRHEGMGVTVDKVFGDRLATEDFEDITPEQQGKNGERSATRDANCWKLVIVHKAVAAKQAGVGRADEGGYELFEIRWVRC